MLSGLHGPPKKLHDHFWKFFHGHFSTLGKIQWSRNCMVRRPLCNSEIIESPLVSKNGHEKIENFQKLSCIFFLGLHPNQRLLINSNTSTSIKMKKKTKNKLPQNNKSTLVCDYKNASLVMCRRLSLSVHD